MGQEAVNGERNFELMYQFITSELVDQRERALKITLRKVQKAFPEIKPMVRDAKKFVRLTDKSLDDQDLPSVAAQVRDKYFEQKAAAADLFEELVDITQELKKYQT